MTDEAARAELDDLRATNAEMGSLHHQLLRAHQDVVEERDHLRRAVIDLCDTYSANRAEKRKVKALRSIANKGGTFSPESVAYEIGLLEDRDREAAEVLEEVLDAIGGYDYARSQPTPAQIAEWRKVLR